MAGMYKRFMKKIPGEYIVVYNDDSVIQIPLEYRVNIVAANDNTLGRDMDIGLFGTVGNLRFINLPTFTWSNPHPDKRIKEIKVMSGNSKDMSLMVFGISLD
jgi:hypothetical protein